MNLKLIFYFRGLASEEPFIVSVTHCIETLLEGIKYAMWFSLCNADKSFIATAVNLTHPRCNLFLSYNHIDRIWLVAPFKATLFDNCYQLNV